MRFSITRLLSAAVSRHARRGDSTAESGSRGNWQRRLIDGGLLGRLGGLPRARCCGIVGYLGDKDAQAVLSHGINILQNRGYDSAGISTLSPKGKFITTKHASKGTTSDAIDLILEEAPKLHKGHTIGIGHTRWATHGGKTDNNAHPHHDYKDRISLIHNGTIENYLALKKRCTDAKIPFRSETDTEVIANLIGMELDKGQPFEKAVNNVVGQLQGTWGLCIMHRDNPDRLILARNGSPLVVGSSENQVFVASEPTALAQFTGQFLPLRDGEVAVVTRRGIDHLYEGRALQDIPEMEVASSPAPYPHWTVKEIMEQPQSLSRALNHGGRISADGRVVLGGLDANAETFARIKSLVLAGCGTSLYAAMYGDLLMQYLNVFDSVKAVDASELTRNHFFKVNPGLLMLSQSGETLDVVRACQLGDSMGVPKLSLVNAVGSQLARMAGTGVYLNAGREVAVASTKAFTSQVSCLGLVAHWFSQVKGDETAMNRRRELLDALQRLPVYAGRTLRCADKCRDVASSIADADSLFVLGKGFSYPVALEGALKIKEVSYVHAEGFAGSALKHGPFALLDAAKRTPVIMVIPTDQHTPAMLNAAHEIKARGARVICITDDAEIVKGLADETIVVPNNGPLTALLATIPMQLIAYHLALKRGINPDKPRGLAKTVTVA